MRTIILAIAAACALSADPLNGITYTWGYEDGYITNMGLVIVANFSAPVSTYTFHIELPNSVVDPVISVDPQQQTTWLNSYTAVVSSSMPVYLTDHTKLTIDVSYRPFTGGSGVDSFYFTSLVDPPVDPPADAPEPASIVLTVLGISGLALCRRWTNRNSIPGASTLHALAAPGLR